MGLFTNRAAAGSLVGGVIGWVVGGVLGILIAFGLVTLVIPEPEPTHHGPDPIAMIQGLFFIARSAFWVIAGGTAGSVAGAIAGGMIGAARATRRAAAPVDAQPAPTADEEIAALKARIAELERDRRPDGSL